MAVDDDNERELAQLPRRARPNTTRTDARTLPREVTMVTRPLFTADESADSAASDAVDDEGDGEGDDGDLFDAPQETRADTPLLSDATEFNLERPQLTAERARSDDDEEEEDDDDEDDSSVAVERTVVSLVLPDHLREASNDENDDEEEADELEDDDELEDAAPTQFTLEPRDSVVDAAPRDVTQSHYVYATQPPAARPAWQFAVLAVVGVVVLAVAVVVVVAAFAASPAPPPASAP